MRYYILTTTKFAEECITYLTYGSTQSNWLANIDVGDMIFLSQFNYKSQNLFGSFQVTKSLFYDKTTIYPQQKYFYRIQYNPVGTIKEMEETSLYLHGVQSDAIAVVTRLINLIQQNKHLHCICLTREEGEFILNAFLKSGLDYALSKAICRNMLSVTPSMIVDRNYIWHKNNLDHKDSFSAESDLESFLLFALKKAQSDEYKSINTLLNKHPNNDLRASEIYNQFIFGNAYPSDIVIINDHNINVFELKKDGLSNNSIQQIEKEIKKHLYFSLFYNRLKSSNISNKKFNFYLVYVKTKNSQQLKNYIFEKYHQFCNEINTIRKNTITFVEYEVKDKILLLEEQ